jgi:hypothetical protein
VVRCGQRSRVVGPIDLALVAAALFGCGSATDAPAGGARPVYSIESATTVDLCRLEGGSAQHPGVYGTDLGFSFVPPSDDPGSECQVLLFGDTWKSSISVCDYPPRRSDDFQATLPYGVVLMKASLTAKPK